MPTRYVALLRAVNVGGVKVLMWTLAAMCRDAGFACVETYIASGNVVFDGNASPATVKAELETRLQACYARKPVGVVLRTGQEMLADAERQSLPAG